MGQYRRVGHNDRSYMSVEDVRAELEQEAEEFPAALAMLTQILTVLEQAGTPIRTDHTMARRYGHLEVVGPFPDGRIRSLIVAQADHGGAHYPRTPDENTAPSADRPLTATEIATHTDGDDDMQALAVMVNTLISADPHLIVEAIEPAWGEMVLSNPLGERFTLRAAQD